MFLNQRLDCQVIVPECGFSLGQLFILGLDRWLLEWAQKSSEIDQTVLASSENSVVFFRRLPARRQIDDYLG
jgi:hypothetical protein